VNCAPPPRGNFITEVLNFNVKYSLYPNRSRLVGAWNLRGPNSQVIDWEYSFVGPSDLAGRLSLRLQMYPEAILPQERDANGKTVYEDWRKMSENRDLWVNQVELHESPSCDAPRLCHSMFGVQADILYMLHMWEDRMPWMYTYPATVKEGLGILQETLKQVKERT
jgi:hypothetical protein